MDLVEKRERQKCLITLKFQPFLPCTTDDCLNEATVATASYDPLENGWLIFPLCKECVRKMGKNYGVE